MLTKIHKYICSLKHRLAKAKQDVKRHNVTLIILTYQIQWTSPKWGQSYFKRDINLEHALYAVFFLKKTSTLRSVSCYENHLLYNANKALYYIVISKKHIIVCICTFISSSLHLFDTFLIYLKEMIKWTKKYLQIMYMYIHSNQRNSLITTCTWIPLWLYK